MLKFRESNKCPNCKLPDLVTLGGHSGNIPIYGYVCIHCWWEEIDPEVIAASKMAKALLSVKEDASYNTERIDGAFPDRDVREAFKRLSKTAGDAIKGLPLEDAKPEEQSSIIAEPTMLEQGVSPDLHKRLDATLKNVRLHMNQADRFLELLIAETTTREHMAQEKQPPTPKKIPTNLLFLFCPQCGWVQPEDNNGGPIEFQACTNPKCNFEMKNPIDPPPEV